MMRFTSRLIAASTVLAASAALTSSIAGEALLSAAVPTAPPKAYVIPKKGVSDAIRKAVENPARRKEDVERDGYRRPAEVLALAGLKPGQKVIEFGAFGELDTFGNYYTQLLSDIVGPKGMVYMYDTKEVDAQFGANNRAFAAAHPNTRYWGGDFDKIQFEKGIDVVVSVLFYHELTMRGVDMTPFHDKLFKAMKPGAIYLIVDHAGVIGEDMKKTLPMHRLDPSVIRSAVGAAGFEMVIDSRLLERTDDDHKWSVYTDGKKDQTDQTVYMFRKPVVY